VCDTRYEWAYLFGAVCPERAVGVGIVMPYANTKAMNKHLQEIGKAVAPGAHAALVLDGAGWHDSADLVMPDNITPMVLPPYSPELNPVENIWEYLRKNKRSAGYDAGKKVKGKKRHILVDTLGLLLRVIVHPADIQDRDGGILLLSTLFGLFPFLKKLFADGGYQGPQFEQAVTKILPEPHVEIVKRSDQAKGFKILPKRWVVERTFAWLSRCRRLAKDFENLTRIALAFVKLASIRFMLRRLCQTA